MSQENVEIVRRAFEEFSRGGWEPLMGTVLAARCRLGDMTPIRESPGLGTYRGYDELRAFFEDWFGTFPFEEWDQELEGGHRLRRPGVVALTRQHGHGSASGAVAQLEYARSSSPSQRGE